MHLFLCVGGCRYNWLEPGYAGYRLLNVTGVNYVLIIIKNNLELLIFYGFIIFILKGERKETVKFKNKNKKNKKTFPPSLSLSLQISRKILYILYFLIFLSHLVHVSTILCFA